MRTAIATAAAARTSVTPVRRTVRPVVSTRVPGSASPGSAPRSQRVVSRLTEPRAAAAAANGTIARAAEPSISRTAARRPASPTAI